jgi:phosphoglycerol transferase MdoB-like AlkP superfamily enzyme
MNRFKAQRVIATVHSFRFFGLVLILPGVVGPNIPAGFATFAAYGDFATGVLAILALLTVRIRPLFSLFVVAFNLVGTVDLLAAYYHAVRGGLPRLRGNSALPTSSRSSTCPC